MTSRKRYALVLIALVVMVATMLLMPSRKRFYTAQGVVWTTEYHITYEARHTLEDSIQLVLNSLDMSVSPFNAASLVSTFNQSDKGCVIDSYIKRLYEAARVVWRTSEGAYDPTVMPLVNAWGFGYKTGVTPTRQHLDSLLAFVGLNKTALHGDTLIKQDPRTQLDFSSIAKGLACDEIGRMLTRNSATNWLVEIGGEVAASGVNKRGSSWQVAVDMPTDDSVAVHSNAMVLTVDSGGVATSGNYRRYHEQNGRRVAHIINPHTGDSQPSDLLSVTVIAQDCMTADAWATACIVLGRAATQRLMQDRTDLGVMTIASDSAGNYVVWSNAPFARCVNAEQ